MDTPPKQGLDLDGVQGHVHVHVQIRGMGYRRVILDVDIRIPRTDEVFDLSVSFVCQDREQLLLSV